MEWCSSIVANHGPCFYTFTFQHVLEFQHLRDKLPRKLKLLYSTFVLHSIFHFQIHNSIKFPIGDRTIGPKTIGPRTTRPRTIGPKTIRPKDNWPERQFVRRTIGPRDNSSEGQLVRGTIGPKDNSSDGQLVQWLFFLWYTFKLFLWIILNFSTLIYATFYCFAYMTYRLGLLGRRYEVLIRSRVLLI